MNHRLWIVLIAEHVLLLIKVGVTFLLPFLIYVIALSCSADCSDKFDARY